MFHVLDQVEIGDAISDGTENAISIWSEYNVSVRVD